MDIENIKKGSTIRVLKIGDIESTAVNISVLLQKLCEAEIKLEIIELNIKIDLKKPKDVLRICTRLLIDKEFEDGILKNSKPIKIIPYRKRGSKLDKFAKAIVSKVNKKIPTRKILKQYKISQNAYWKWLQTRTKLSDDGTRILM